MPTNMIKKNEWNFVGGFLCDTGITILAKKIKGSWWMRCEAAKGNATLASCWFRREYVATRYTSFSKRTCSNNLILRRQIGHGAPTSCRLQAVQQQTCLHGWNMVQALNKRHWIEWNLLFTNNSLRIQANTTFGYAFATLRSKRLWFDHKVVEHAVERPIVQKVFQLLARHTAAVVKVQITTKSSDNVHHLFVRRAAR